MTKSRPIIFSADSVRAILEGRKTQTRRVCKPQPRDGRVVECHECGKHKAPRGRDLPLGSSPGYCTPDRCESYYCDPFPDYLYEGESEATGSYTYSQKAPHGQAGDEIWVRETWAQSTIVASTDKSLEGSERIIYRASADQTEEQIISGSWRSPIHMPRTASRLTLRITDVRVERLQEISEDDAWSEGAHESDIHPDLSDPIDQYRYLWDSINGKKHPWEGNPWVWVYEFERES